MDYVLDIGLRDLSTGKEITKRYEICKPLGKVEFTPVPYVTENSRVTIILPIEENQITLALDFLNGYASTIIDRKEKTFLMLALLYQYDSDSQGGNDPFIIIKNFATKTSNKHRNDDIKLAWVSIRLPTPQKQKTYLITEYPSLNFAVVDLALKKIGLDSLILVLDPHVNITGDFLNRIRMNTIQNFQIFNPIPFRLYDPKISGGFSMEITKNNGHFDREEYRYVSFYSRDYVTGKFWEAILFCCCYGNGLTFQHAKSTKQCCQ